MPAVGGSFVDLERGVYYRCREGQALTNKRQSPVPIPPRLLAYLRRWHARGVIRNLFCGVQRSTGAVGLARIQARGLAKLGSGISLHTLRHTAATRLMQNGRDPWQAAAYVGMSVKVLIEVHRHDHPDQMKDAVMIKFAGQFTATAKPQKRSEKDGRNVTVIPRQ